MSPNDRTAGLRAALIALTALTTAGIHLYLGVSGGVAGIVRVEFFAAVAGFTGSLLLRYVPVPARGLMRWLGRFGLIATALGTIVGYFVVMGFVWTPLAIAAKVDEVVLIVAVSVDAVVSVGAAQRGTAPDRRHAVAGTLRRH